MIIWWLFDEYFTYLPGSEPLTHFRQAMLPQNTGGQACTRRKGGLGFVVFITARWPLCSWMPAMTIIRTQGCELAITVFAFVTQESLGLLALRLTLLTAHWRPQHWQFILLSKIMMARTPRQIEIVQVTTLGFTIVWPNSQHPNEQQAKTNIIKACIENESDHASAMVWSILTRLCDDVAA